MKKLIADVDARINGLKLMIEVLSRNGAPREELKKHLTELARRKAERTQLMMRERG